MSWRPGSPFAATRRPALPSLSRPPRVALWGRTGGRQLGSALDRAWEATLDRDQELLRQSCRRMARSAAAFDAARMTSRRAALNLQALALAMQMADDECRTAVRD